MAGQARHSDIGLQVLLLFPSCPDRPEEAGAHVKKARRIARIGLGGRCTPSIVQNVRQ
jgi:hypothetical protein